MTDEQVEKHIAKIYKKSDQNHRDYIDGARLRSADGEVLGLIRHSSREQYGRNSRLRNLAKDGAGAYWHYHETNGVAHATRRVRSSELMRAVL